MDNFKNIYTIAKFQILHPYIHIKLNIYKQNNKSNYSEPI